MRSVDVLFKIGLTALVWMSVCLVWLFYASALDGRRQTTEADRRFQAAEGRLERLESQDLRDNRARAIRSLLWKGESEADEEAAD